MNHLDIALGSQGEVDVQLELAMRLGFCAKEAQQRIVERVDAIGRMLNGLIESQQPVEADWQ
ncbi:MAG: four helix bundle protein [Acidobacteria bacterium]|nr:MAG: four helix bundle protein [Acidobacteriota bacterium]